MRERCRERVTCIGIRRSSGPFIALALDMKRRFVQINGELVEYTDSYDRPAPDVMPDIAPYKSMVTGEIIESRSKHREHLKRHGYEEVGNDSSLFKPRKIPDVAPQHRKELIRSQIDRLSHKEFTSMHKAFIDNVKWNSRER